ncbi:extracellular solute-binding protein [Paenibacillus flagellatus]|uniref:ABC transporter substrate-binding protein n=1 Tax=Paenibacillus flagellatus TaxID=2211139 RepID=A0A2V5KAD5_9BACL|nr:extracellular solute-binding protein [Paenibacillus flagellatus]PYI50780.1 ABC transporter substrate-binding protein [Paenibacillus flagellatus]
MTMKRIARSGFALTAAAAVLIAGCSGGGEPKANDAADKTKDGNVNATGLPIVKEPLTLKFATTKSAQQKKPHEEMEAVKAFEAQTNIRIQWDATAQGQGYPEKKNLMFAGGDLPDVFFGPESLRDDDLLRYGPQGLLVPLETLIPKYAPRIQEILDNNPSIKKSITAPDGHIYSIPTIVDGMESALGEVWFINKTWLDKLNLQMPTTTEQFEQVLKAFKDNDPNGNGKADEIPLSFLYGNALNGIYSFSGSFGTLDNGSHLSAIDGKVTFTAVQQGFKESIAYLNRLYKQGLIDQEAFTHDRNVYFAKGRSKGGAVYGVFSGFHTPNVVGTEYEKQYVPLPPLKGPGGQQMWNEYEPRYFARGGFAITSANKHPEASLRWIDELYKEKNSLQWSYGPIGVTLKENADGTYGNMPTPSGMSYDEFRHSEAPGNTSAAAILMDTVAKMEKNDNVKKRLEYLAIYKPFMKNTAYPNILFDPKDMERLTVLQTDIMTYVTQMQPKWVIDGNIEGEWNDYLKKLDQMGLKEMMTIYQSNYDRYQSVK